MVEDSPNLTILKVHMHLPTEIYDSKNTFSKLPIKNALDVSFIV